MPHQRSELNILGTTSRPKWNSLSNVGMCYIVVLRFILLCCLFLQLYESMSCMTRLGQPHDLSPSSECNFLKTSDSPRSAARSRSETPRTSGWFWSRRAQLATRSSVQYRQHPPSIIDYHVQEINDILMVHTSHLWILWKPWQWFIDFTNVIEISR